MSRTTMLTSENRPLVECREAFQAFCDFAYAAMRKMPYPQLRTRILQMNFPLRTNYPVEQDVVPEAIRLGRFAELMLCFADPADAPMSLSPIHDTTTAFRWIPVRHG